MSERRERLRVMIDANVLIAGSAFPRWSYEVLQHALRSDFQLVLCPLVIEQAKRHLRRKFPDHLERFEAFLALCDYEEVPNPLRTQVEQHCDLVRDVTDVPIALAAIDAGVDCLVSEGKDLSAQDESTARLRMMLRVYISGTFLREMMGWSSRELEGVRGRAWRDMPFED